MTIDREAGEIIAGLPQLNTPAANPVDWLIKEGIKGQCWYRDNWPIRLPGTLSPTWTDTWDDICDGQPKAPSPPSFPGVSPSIYAAGFRSYCYMPNGVVGDCTPLSTTVFLTGMILTDGLPVGFISVTSGPAVCEGLPFAPFTNFSSFVTHVSSGGTTATPYTDVYGTGNATGVLRCPTDQAVWRPIPPQGVPADPPGQLPPYRPANDWNGDPISYPNPGDGWPLPVILPWGAIIKVSPEVNVKVDVGGISIETGSGNVLPPGDGLPTLPPDRTNRRELPPGNGANRGDEPGDIPPNEDIEYFIIRTLQVPENLKRSAPTSNADAIVLTGWYAFTYRGVEGTRYSIDRLVQAAVPDGFCDGIAIGSYTGCVHQVAIVSREV